MVHRPIPAAQGLLLIGLFSAFKGFNSQVQGWGQPYWIVDYGHGLIKRGFLGSVYWTLFDRADLNRIWSSVLTLHLVVSVALLAGIMEWVRQQRPDNALLSVGLLFAASLFMPTLVYLSGYLDVYLYALAAVAAYFAAQGELRPAIGIGIIAPFIHESYIFVWAPIALLLLLKSTEWPHLIAAAMPVIASMAVYILHSQSAAVIEVTAAPLPDGVKEGMINVQFGQSIIWAFKTMLLKWWENPGRAAKSIAFFTLPTAACLWIYIHARLLSLQEAGALLVASFLPALILLIAWDLSRFLVATSLSAVLAILFAETAWMPARRKMAGWSTTAAGLLAGFYLLCPFVYAYFESAMVASSGLLPLERWMIGRAIITTFGSGY
jgi:hypothetical protein